MKSLRFSELSLDDYIRNIEEGYFLNAVKNGDYDRVNDRLYLFTQERSINELALLYLIGCVQEVIARC